MSINVMNLVWNHYPRGGSEKLALLALADWCDDEGGSLYPSIATVARKIAVSESQARRILHGFIDEGLLEVVGNHGGGARTQTRRYRLVIARLAPARVNASPRAAATPCTGAHHPSHACASPLAPVRPNPSVNRQEPSLPAPAKPGAATLQIFLERCKAEGAKPIAADDPVFAYADKVGLSEQMIALAWAAFKARFLAGSQKQKDWRAHFRNAVRANWFRLWFIADDGSAALTTAGRQAAREYAIDCGEGRA